MIQLSLYLHDLLDGSISLILPHSNSTLSSQTSLDLLLSSHVLFFPLLLKAWWLRTLSVCCFLWWCVHLLVALILPLPTSHKILICCLLIKTSLFGSNLAHTHVLGKQAEWCFPIYHMHRMVKWTHETRSVLEWPVSQCQFFLEFVSGAHDCQFYLWQQWKTWQQLCNINSSL